MPELPEVETVVRGLQRAVVGDAIESVWIGERKQPLKSPARQIASALEGARITNVRRMGKHIVIDLQDSGQAATTSGNVAPRGRRKPAKVARPGRAKPTAAHFIVHLGMTGRMLVAAAGAPVAKHTHFIARLASGREMRFVDPRMFGKLAVEHEAFDPGGSEPLEVGFEPFAALFRKRKTPIKSALLNQRLLRGVGNIYADESLFRAGVRPRRRAATLTRAELWRLFESVRQVL